MALMRVRVCVLGVGALIAVKQSTCRHVDMLTCLYSTAELFAGGQRSGAEGSECAVRGYICAVERLIKHVHIRSVRFKPSKVGCRGLSSHRP